VQLGLFRKPENTIIDQLSRVDTTRMTPLDALNYLDELRELAKGITN
jgi:hypothetical protein